MSKDKGTFQGYNIGEDCTACCVLFGVTTGWSHIENRISVKTFHVRWIVSSSLPQRPVQENIAGFSPSDSSHTMEYIGVADN